MALVKGGREGVKGRSMGVKSGMQESLGHSVQQSTGKLELGMCRKRCAVATVSAMQLLCTMLKQNRCGEVGMPLMITRVRSQGA